MIDREIFEGLSDLKQGRVRGPYKSASTMTASLRRMADVKSGQAQSKRGPATRKKLKKA